ncbi:MAG: glycerol-3-phosphate dehydrogenase/oxidase [Panacagrimonas sp.]|nr:glycerol-3-phosphate dehydrogenase/oxidase [Panacagrimonas sp.]MCC2657234.1 glycerol-3-phosphate dehydrogenase/oxidase [Panacagrimonas sp.]
MGASHRLAGLAPHYDLVIIGGGITGAGVLREAVRTGASVLLVERHDFASGTSSGSSKLVHGGLRYLQTGQWGLTLESVRERGRLLREAPGLVEAQPFLMPVHRGARPGRALLQIGLFVYDLMAGRLASRWLGADEVRQIEPLLSDETMLGAMRFIDARTDDARLVQRLIEESRASGATALNYARVDDLVRTSDRVTGVVIRDAADASGETRMIDASIVVNATGAGARQFAPATTGAPPLRPLRGSHFVFPRDRLPITNAISWLHPRDRRPVFAYPWEGAVLYGTTDLDHDTSAMDAPRMTADESVYLIEALRLRFPDVTLSAGDALSTYAGVRPVVAGGKDAPSAESRESALWSAPGIVSVTGGKLTTFRVSARQVLAQAARQVAGLMPRADSPLFEVGRRSEGQERRLDGRLGPGAAMRVRRQGSPASFALLGDTPYCLAELRWSAEHEQVVHLEDLLLRRTRIGLVSKDGAHAHLPAIRSAVQGALGWDDARWNAEEVAYLSTWQRQHSASAIA